MASAAIKAMKHDMAPVLPGAVVKIFKAGDCLNQIQRVLDSFILIFSYMLSPN